MFCGLQLFLRLYYCLQQVYIHHDLQQMMNGGNRLAHGLGSAASLMENHEADSAHNLSGVFGGAQST